MQVKIIIERADRHCVRHLADIKERGDLLKEIYAAMENYRTEFLDVPLFDHSSIRIERS